MPKKDQVQKLENKVKNKKGKEHFHNGFENMISS